MDRETLRQFAIRKVAEGRRRAAALCEDARRDRQLAEMLPNPEKEILRIKAAGKFQRAASIRQLCKRMIDQHGLSLKATGRVWQPRPVKTKIGNNDRAEVITCVMRWQ